MELKKRVYFKKEVVSERIFSLKTRAYVIYTRESLLVLARVMKTAGPRKEVHTAGRFGEWRKKDEVTVRCSYHKATKRIPSALLSQRKRRNKAVNK